LGFAAGALDHEETTTGDRHIQSTAGVHQRAAEADALGVAEHFHAHRLGVGVNAAKLGARGFEASGAGVGDVVTDGVQLFSDGVEAGQGNIEAHDDLSSEIGSGSAALAELDDVVERHAAGAGDVQYRTGIADAHVLDQAVDLDGQALIISVECLNAVLAGLEAHGYGVDGVSDLAGSLFTQLNDGFRDRKSTRLNS